ncbi:MAG: HEAT repeat domain-containing protein [Paludisphaera borealis]|uniref:PVC-type heme-binding CxxCH protein n=1 Tax=Paludisphaera borealis TaxID=1387353 RepID=UPI002847BC55|nr:PVC-type heme-binding CxxCH protein [Paludisphaera borealis]MDR3618928.1 HEAT repeat domain-containing protein [Paludisphaera borealis]
MMWCVRAFVLASALGTTFSLQAQDDLARELPRIPAREPAEALKSFVLHPGFRLEAVATEPMAASPVCVCYDADGRLYVVEMRGYPYVEDKPSGAVVRLEDRDGDGRFESRTKFLDALTWPTGVVPYDGGVFVTAAPEIIYAKDTDGDGVADVRKVVFTGFGTSNVQGLLNGLLWGPDGWIYGVASANGGEIRNLAHPELGPVSVRGRDFRFKPDGSAFESISGGGQNGHSFDDWGHRFTCSNSNHIRQIVLPAHDLDRNPSYVPPGVILDIPTDGAAAPVFRLSAPEPWRIVRTRQRAADPEMRKRLAPTELFAAGFFTSATGVTIYRGSAYPEAYRGNAFIGDVGGNLVHRKTLAVAGSIYSAERADPKAEFLASTDNWFRPVNFANTPNGTLLIVDMYRETIEHPVSIPEPIKKHLDLTSGKDRGRLYELVSEGGRRLRSPRLSQAATADLVSLLADPDSWWRETAQRLLVERKDVQAAAALRELASRRPTALGRLHALWTLDALGLLEGRDLELGLADPEPRLREQAARLAEHRIKADRKLFEHVLPLAADPDSMVRFQVALTLGEAGDDRRALEALATIATRDAADSWTRAAVMTSIPGRADELLDVLADRDGFLGKAAGEPWLNDLATLVGASRDAKRIEALVQSLFDKKLSDEVRGRVVLAVGRGLMRVGGSLRTVLTDPTWRRLDPLFADAAKVVDSDEPSDRRAIAIAVLALGAPDRVIDAVAPMLDARQPLDVQLAALRALAEQDGPGVADRIIGQWKSMSPSARREAAEVLFSRKEWVAQLLSAVEAKRLASSEIDPSRLKQLRTHGDARLREQAVKLFGSDADGTKARTAVIQTYRPALDRPGDRVKGRAAFLKTCGTCHKAEGQGVEVGPDLATVATRSPEDILTHVLDPNREVAPTYLNYNVATVDGRVVSGIIASESASALVLKRAEGVSEVVPRSQIEAVASTGISLMPEGLEKDLTPNDLADVIAFIRSINTAGAQKSEAGGK